MKLIALSDFLHVVDLSANPYKKVIDYDSFLRQTLELWMFVPCKLVDGVWVVLEEPKQCNYDTNPSGNDRRAQDLKEYQEAKDKVLFSGFSLKYSDKFVTTVSNEKLWFNFKMTNIFINDRAVCIIEDLVKYNLELTPTAKKQIGL